MHVSHWVQFTVEETRFNIIILTRKKNTGVAGHKKLNKCLLALLMYSGNVNTNDTKSEI